MFTGLIETVGTIVRCDNRGSSQILYLKLDKFVDEICLGDSIAVNGICLTVTRIEGSLLLFDVSYETLERTSLNSINPPKKVNVERAAKLGQHMGGHLVLGHVDTTAKVKKIKKISNAIEFTFTTSLDIDRYLVEKGSITVDGISLTLTNVNPGSFSIAVIPFSASHTTLSELKPGEIVNIETDIIGKYVEKLLVPYNNKSEKSDININFLKENGFF